MQQGAEQGDVDNDEGDENADLEVDEDDAVAGRGDRQSGGRGRHGSRKRQDSES